MKVIYNESELNVEKGTKIIDIFEQQVENSNRDIIGCRFNNEIKSLDYEIKEDGEVKLIDGTDRDGKRIYTRGLI